MVMFPQEEQAKDHSGSSFSSISLWIIWVSWFNIIFMCIIFFICNICVIAIWIIQGNLTTKFIRWSSGFGRCNICYSHVQFHSWCNLYLSRLFRVCIWTSKYGHLTWHWMCLPQSLVYVLSSTFYTYFKNTHKKQWTPYLTLIILMSKYSFPTLITFL